MAGAKILIAGASLMALAACSDGNFLQTFTHEAGAFLDEGTFGNPTMHNQLVQKCVSGGYLAKGHIIYEPKVVRAPVGSPAPYVAQVHCGGYLNGKYAQVIFREYVASATESPPRGGQGAAFVGN